MRFGVGPGTYDHRHLTQLIFTMHGVAWCSGIGDVAECNTNWFCLCEERGDSFADSDPYCRWRSVLIIEVMQLD